MNEFSTLRRQADALKAITSSVLSTTSKQELQTHRDALMELSMQFDQLDNSWAELIEQKRRDLADTRQERRVDELCQKELKEHARRVNNAYWDLRNNEPRL